MLNTFRSLVISQYEAALSALKACVDKSPDNVWTGPVANYTFFQVVFHTLFFTDLYLGPDEESFAGQPFHRRHPALFAKYDVEREPLEDPAPPVRDKATLLAYLDFCRRKAGDVVGRETEAILTGPCGFRRGDRRNFSRAELHVYNIRHIQHHSAQLSLRLRLETHDGAPWMHAGWREAAL